MQFDSIVQNDTLGPDRHDCHLHRGHLGRQNQPIIITVGRIKPPIERVEKPQLVCQANSSSPLSAVWKDIPNTLLKFCPKSCEVQACSALPLGINDSNVSVASAPANRSPVDFQPT